MESLKSNGKYSPVKLIVAVTGLLTVLSGSALAWYKAIAGEPEAKEVREDSAKAYGDVHKTLAQIKDTIEDLEKTQKKQGEVLETQTRRMIHFQGFQGGLSAGSLLAKNEALEKKYDTLVARRAGRFAVQMLKDELKLERRMRKLAEAKEARSGRAVAKPLRAGAAQIKLPPLAPFKRTIR